jgi:rRNA small subunit pseudouridine methyltransferase Nep1
MKEMRKIKIILMNSSLELLPKEWENKKELKRIKKFFKYDILDSNYHYKLMKNWQIDEKEKRGRPDIVHFSLLTLLDSLLNHEKKLEIYLHTIDNLMFKVNPEVRLPRNYNRFLGIMEQLLKGNNNPFFEKLNISVEEFLLKNSKKIALLTKNGRLIRKNEREKLKEFDTFLIGAFPKGEIKLNQKIIKNSIEKISIYKKGLTAWTVCSIIANCLYFD